MEFVNVSSSNVSAIGYDYATQTLGVRFINGGEYEYTSVPADVYTGMLSAESVGQYLHQNIKGIYAYRKVG